MRKYSRKLTFGVMAAGGKNNVFVTGAETSEDDEVWSDIDEDLLLESCTGVCMVLRGSTFEV